MDSWLYPPEPSRLGECSTIPTLDAACAALEGNPPAIAASVVWTALRALIMGVGIYATGERDTKALVKQSIGGALAVEAFVFGWSAMTKGSGTKNILSPYPVERPCEPLPSDSAVCRLVEGQDGDALAGVAGTLAARAVIAGVGIFVAGEHRPKHLITKAAASVTAIEVALLLQAGSSKT